MMTITHEAIQTKHTDSIKANEALSHYLIREAIKAGVVDFCLCPGNRNAPIVSALKEYPDVNKYYWYEERSAAFFALGRARRDGRPVAIVPTSGTASAELLPAAMEAYYTQVPLLLMTADRPRRFRGTCAPQSAEQVGLFGVYAPFAQDIAQDEVCLLSSWDKKAPAHLNVCLEDPIRPRDPNLLSSEAAPRRIHQNEAPQYLNDFLASVSHPLVVVSAIPQEARKAVAEFLINLKAPVVLEGISGLREEPRLTHLRIARTDGIWKSAADAGYPIDGILRIGGIPTFSLWRDLENLYGKIKICSISQNPFSGLSCADAAHVSLTSFFNSYKVRNHFHSNKSNAWLVADKDFRRRLEQLFLDEPKAEASLVHELSKRIPRQANIYLGNSLPIREWDLAATNEPRGYSVTASRGVNGIDGQLSTFLGSSIPGEANWALVGDLTALYDMPGPWIMPQLNNIHATIAVINNSGGQLFTRFFTDKIFLHPHNLEFGPLADLWGLKYDKWNLIPNDVAFTGNRLIEIVPDADASARFNKHLAGM